MNIDPDLLATIIGDLEVRVTPWRKVWWDDPYVSMVRIWKARLATGWWQRHEWQLRGRNETRMEAWIPGTKAFPRDAEPLP